MELDFQTYREKILKPISSSEPCGSDPKYETLYEGIRAEVAKASGIGHGAPAAFGCPLLLGSPLLLDCPVQSSC